MLGPVTTRPDAAAPRHPHGAPTWAVVTALVLVAANLRTLMASLPPLAETIRADLGLSSAWMGVLTTLPVLCMGLLAPVANQVARRVGTASAVGGGITLVLAGLVLRGSGGGQVWSLYAGTVVAGAGIALAGTLLPGVVKTVFPARRAGMGTGLTMVAMMGLAGVASAAAVPLADALGGWSASLLAWAPLAALAVLAWVPMARAVRRHAVPDAPAHRGRLARAAVGEPDRLAARPLPRLPVVAVLLLAGLAGPDLRVGRLDRPRRRPAHGRVHRRPARVGPGRTGPARPRR